MTMQVLDLSHDMHTHPGLPGPERDPSRTRQEHQGMSGARRVERVLVLAPVHGVGTWPVRADAAISQ